MSEWSRVRELFAAAADLPAPEQTGFLDRECQGDPELRDRVQRLLTADALGDEESVPFEQEACLAAAPGNDYAGLRIGAFEIVGVIGRGGMGVVFEARQEQPSRSVALKMLSSPLATADELARFQYEVEVLGQLQHPGIAQVFDAGSWQDPATGRTLPWFAMELVTDARTITAYADEQGLDVRARVRLLAGCAEAVQYGHGLGVLHRDLKPDNILIDGAGRSKIIDFGTARSTDPGGTRYTMAGMLLGTPLYMSPEQFDGDPGSVDAQTDVYALGVILYHLLTDRPPIDPGQDTWSKFADRVRHVEPTRPSTLRTGVSARGFDDDLDWVCMAALSKEKQERYPTVAAFASDLQRYLDREPVLAGPPSATRTLRRFVQRNRILVGGIAAVCIVLIAGVITTTWWMFQAQQQRVVADRQKVLAERQARRAETINSFYGEILKLADPSEGRYQSRPDWTVREAIQASSKWFERLDTEPEIEASVRILAGDALSAFDDHRQAEVHLVRAIEILEAVDRPSDDLGRALAALAFGKTGQGKHAEALEGYRRAQEVFRKVHGEQHPLVAKSHLQIGSALVSLGKVDQGEKSVRRARRLYETLPDDQRRFLAMCTMLQASIAKRRKQLGPARDLYVQALDLYRAANKQWHPSAATAHEYLGLVFLDLGERDRAMAQFHQAAAVFEKALGVDCYECGRVHLRIANLLVKLSRHDETESHLRRTAVSYAKARRPDDKTLVLVRHRLVRQLRCRGAIVEALQVIGQLLPVLDTATVTPRKVRDIRRDHAGCLRANGEPEAAAKILDQLLVFAKRKKLSGERRATEIEIARTAVCLGDLARAEKMLADLAADMRDLPATSVGHGLLGHARAEWLVATGQTAAAETAFLAARDNLRRLGPRHRTVREVLLALLQLARSSGDKQKIERYAAELRSRRPNR